MPARLLRAVLSVWRGVGVRQVQECAAVRVLPSVPEMDPPVNPAQQVEDFPPEYWAAIDDPALRKVGDELAHSQWWLPTSSPVGEIITHDQ